MNIVPTPFAIRDENTGSTAHNGFKRAANDENGGGNVLKKRALLPMGDENGFNGGILKSKGSETPKNTGSRRILGTLSTSHLNARISGYTSTTPSKTSGFRKPLSGLNKATPVTTRPMAVSTISKPSFEIFSPLPEEVKPVVSSNMKPVAVLETIEEEDMICSRRTIEIKDPVEEVKRRASEIAKGETILPSLLEENEQDNTEQETEPTTSSFDCLFDDVASHFELSDEAADVFRAIGSNYDEFLF